MIERAVRAVVAVAAVAVGSVIAAFLVTVALAVAKPTGSEIPLEVFAVWSFGALAGMALFVAAYHQDDPS